MQLIGQTVKHQIYGSGVITDRSDGTLTVRFSEGRKSFLYPQAFSKFLRADNPGTQTEIVTLLHRQEAAEHARVESEIEQWEKEMALRHRKISPRSQGVFDLTQEALPRTLSDWQLTTGQYLSGLSKGSPRIPDRMGPNSMCLVTFRPAGAAESQRRIAGVCMVRDSFDGAACEDGLIEAHPEFRLPLAEDRQPLFWPYITDDEAKKKWGNTTFKYITNLVGERILYDLAGTETTDIARRFYEYYCDLNHLIPRPAKKHAD